AVSTWEIRIRKYTRENKECITGRWHKNTHTGGGVVGGEVGFLEGDPVGAFEGVLVGGVEGASVGFAVGALDGELVGAFEGMSVGGVEGASVGFAVGAFDGELVGAFDGESVGFEVGALDGESVGALEGESVGWCEGASVGFEVGALDGEPVGALEGESAITQSLLVGRDDKGAGAIGGFDGDISDDEIVSEWIPTSSTAATAGKTEMVTLARSQEVLSSVQASYSAHASPAKSEGGVYTSAFASSETTKEPVPGAACWVTLATKSPSPSGSVESFSRTSTRLEEAAAIPRLDWVMAVA
ncbi:hypothetical protein ACHAWF_010539, partial [Thalassiosira exigua]